MRAKVSIKLVLRQHIVIQPLNVQQAAIERELDGQFNIQGRTPMSLHDRRRVVFVLNMLAPTVAKVAVVRGTYLSFCQRLPLFPLLLTAHARL